MPNGGNLYVAYKPSFTTIKISTAIGLAYMKLVLNLR